MTKVEGFSNSQGFRLHMIAGSQVLLMYYTERKQFMTMLETHPAVRAAIEQEARSRRKGQVAYQALEDDPLP